MNPRPLTLAGLAVLVVSLLVAACQMAPEPVPTKPSQPATPAAGPGATPATSQPQGRVTLVASAEPASLDAGMLGYLVETRPVHPSIVEHLNRQDLKTYAGESGLAEKFEQVKPDTWRYTLRKGVKFHNSEGLNADAVVFSLNRIADKSLASRVQKWWPAGGSAVKLDEYVVDVTSSTTDPIQPLRMLYAPIVAPKHAQGLPDDVITKLYGTGPYKLVEWTKGQQIQLTAFDGYWGPSPKIKDVTIIWRPEATVRAAMVKTGEADWAYNLTPELAKQVPKVSAVNSAETMMVRMDGENPVLKDKRVRQAVNLAVDKDTIITRMFGGFAEAAKGQMIGDYVLGFNTDLKPYPFDLEAARKLVAEAKRDGIPVEGTELDFWAARGRFPRLEEMGEVLADTWAKAGLKVRIVIAEQAKWQDAWYSVGPGQKRIAMGASGHDNFGDSQQTLDAYLTCGGRTSSFCNPFLEERVAQTRTLVGEARVRAFKDIWEQAYDEAPFVPLFRMKSISGLSQRLSWEARYDELVMVQDMSLAQ